ncbi:unnamed protein product, partial [Symbiodinium sp. KB8]
HVAAASLQLADACLGKCRATLAKDVGPPPDSVRMIFQVSAKCLGYKYCSMEGALPKFYEIAAAPRESARQQPSLLLRTLRTLFACEARDNALSAHTPRDLAMAAELEALPAAPLPLAAAVSLCMGRDSYIPALAQSTLLRTYGGIGKATPWTSKPNSATACALSNRPPVSPRTGHRPGAQWLDLLRAASAAQRQPHTQGRATTTQGHEDENDLRRRAERAGALAHLSELSAAAMALTALPLALTTRDTLNALRDPAHRSPEPQVPVEPRLRHSHVAPGGSVKALVMGDGLVARTLAQQLEFQ